MESIEKVKRGVAAFVDRELVPTLPKWQGILFGAGAALFLEGKSEAMLKHPFGAMLCLVDGEQVDVDKAYTAVKNQAHGKWPVSIAGFKCSEEDLDKLYRYIKEA